MSDRLRDLFTTEVQSRAGGALRLVERHRMADLKEELALQRSDDVDAATRVKSGKLAGARYMLTGKITRFACKAMGFHSGWGVGRIVGRVTGDGLAGAIAGSVDVRRVSFTGRLDARLIDVETGEVLATFKDEDASGDFSVKVAGGGAEVEYDEELFARVFEPLVERMAARVVSKTVEAVHGGEDAGE